jgi:hypothetical protein
LWGGTEKGAELIEQYRDALHGLTKNRLFLFSDGLVNEGERNHATIFRKVRYGREFAFCSVLIVLVFSFSSFRFRLVLLLSGDFLPILLNVRCAFLTRSDLMEHGTLVSAFGIGDDFDETLMRGIADKGLGAYFFIENAQMIPSFVQFALHSIQTMVGDQAVLTARGQNSGCVEKFFGDAYDLVHGAKLGDLRSDNLRTVLMKMSVAGVSVTANALGEEEVLLCELTWRDGEQEHVLKKTAKVCYTTDTNEVEASRVPEVCVR